MKSYGQGSVFVGPDALKRGLVDEISTIENILSIQETTQVSGLTTAKVKADNPEVYNEIYSIGAQSIDREKIKTDAVTGAQTIERERVTGILDLEGSQETTKKMISEGKTVGEAAIAFRKEEVAGRQVSVQTTPEPDPGQAALQGIVEMDFSNYFFLCNSAYGCPN